MSCKVYFRLFRFQVQWPDSPHAVASGATKRYSASSSIKGHASSLWLAGRQVAPRLSSATAATLGFLGFGWFVLPRRNLHDFLWRVLTQISFYQYFHPWFVRVHLVHCLFPFHSFTTLWSIPMCASAQTRCIIFCRGAAFPLSTFSSFLFS